jgi:outer membrane protein OmpA-like peptidoglycan-associated protein
VRRRDYTFRVAANGGYTARPVSRVRDVQLGGAVDYAAAVGIHPAAPFEAVLEVHGSAGGTLAQSPMEALVGAKFLAGRAVTIDLGGGAGLLGGIGAPDWRLYGGIQFAPSFDPSQADDDEDGLVDARDRCPNDAEDKDGYEDDDGCPDRDNDADGREDTIDQCVNDPEDDDGFLDNDGCPEPDNDKDGVNDVADRCPDAAETVNGVSDEDGCPDDKPPEDSDGDGINDDQDRCPRDAEDLNEFEDTDGCPDERLKNARVVVTAGSIKIKDVIYFDTGKSSIQERSHSLLDEIATVILEHREIKRIRVEGHTDDVGNDLTNLKLSQARAEAVVRYLVSKGVAAERLDAAGFGEMRPIAPNTSDEGRSQNRRVEFIIVDRD